MRIFSSIIVLSLCCMPLVAADNDTEVDVLDLSVDENIATPDVPQKAQAYVRAAMDQLRRHLNKNGFSTEVLRDGEVIEVKVPCDEIFAIGKSSIKPSGAVKLQALNIVARDPEKYKVIVAVHTDDTGDDQYSDSISAERANAIDDFLYQYTQGRETNVIPYGIGKDEPVMPNTSRQGRAANRRIEIYVVPDHGMLQQAGVKKK